MSAAFAAAVDALFADRNLGADAIWKPGGLGGVPVRIVRKAPAQVEPFGDSRAILGSVVVDLRRTAAPPLAVEDVIEIGGAAFRVIAEPVADPLGLVFTVELAPP